MLTRFDWLRRCRTGPELLATLRLFEEAAELPTDGLDLGPPATATNGPCQRCWVYPRKQGRYCATCQAILDQAWQFRPAVVRSILVWGFVNRLPRPRPGSLGFARLTGQPTEGNAPLAVYLHDERRFLVALSHDSLKPWLQELVLYHGTELKGLLQVFPTTGGRSAQMGDVLAHIIHRETSFPPDKLRVRFYGGIEQVFNPRPFEREGVLSFEVSEFLRTMDLAAVFSAVLSLDERKTLYRLLHTADGAQAQFYWGRFYGLLSQQARDMLDGWGVRDWSPHQASLLYELVDYVAGARAD